MGHPNTSRLGTSIDNNLIVLVNKRWLTYKVMKITEYNGWEEGSKLLCTFFRVPKSGFRSHQVMDPSGVKYINISDA